MWNFQWELSCKNYSSRGNLHESSLTYALFTLWSWILVATIFQGDLNRKFDCRQQVEDAIELSSWLQSLENPSLNKTFFIFPRFFEGDSLV